MNDAIPASRNSGEMIHTSRHVARRYCSIFLPSCAPMLRDNTEVRPVERPIQQAIITNSNVKVRPIAATAASPISAA